MLILSVCFILSYARGVRKLRLCEFRESQLVMNGMRVTMTQPFAWWTEVQLFYDRLKNQNLSRFDHSDR